MRINPYSVALKGGVRNRTPSNAMHDNLAGLSTQFAQPVVIPCKSSTYHAEPLDDSDAVTIKMQRTALKLDLPYFVGGTLDGPRADAAVTQRTLLTLDVEAKLGSDVQPPPPEHTVARLKKLGSEAWVYTSIGHRAEAPRYRVVLPLAAPIERGPTAGAVLQATTRYAAAKLGVSDFVDAVSWVLSQPMFLPARLVDGPFNQWYLSGIAWKPRPGAEDPAREVGTPAPVLTLPKTDPVLSALVEAGLYLKEDKQHSGRHYITCPWAAQHTTSNPTQTMYTAAHHGGYAHWGCKCLGTGPDQAGKPHLTPATLTQWLVKGGYLSAATPVEVAVEPGPDPLDDYAAFDQATKVSTLINNPPPPQDWAIKDFAPIGSVTMLAAPGGQGKSLMMLHIAMYGALGLKFAGFDPCGELRTLYVSYEDGARQMYDRLMDIAMDLRDRDNGVFDALHDVAGSLDRNLSLHKVDEDAASWVFLVKPERFTAAQRTARVDWLIGYLKHRGVRLVIFDPMVYTHQLEENDISDMAFYMQTLNYIAARANCAVLVVHHMSKMGRAEQLIDIDQHSLRGASSITDNARSAGVLIGLPTKDAVVFGLAEADVARYAVFKHVKSNYAAPLPLMLFERIGRTLVHRTELVPLDAVQVQEVRVQQKQQRVSIAIETKIPAVLAVLKDHHGPISLTQINVAVGLGWAFAALKKVILRCEELGYTESEYIGERKPSNHQITALGEAFLASQRR